MSSDGCCKHICIYIYMYFYIAFRNILLSLVVLARVQANFSLKDDRDCVNPFIDNSNDSHVTGLLLRNLTYVTTIRIYSYELRFPNIVT